MIGRKPRLRWLGSWLGFILLLVTTTAAQDTSPKSSDPETERVQAIIRQAWQESEQFIKSGGKAGDANHPNRKWAATLWQYRDEHPGTPAAAHATGEALHLLVHAEQHSDLQAKAETLKLDDTAWKQVIHVLLESANHKNDYVYLISKAQMLTKQAADPQIKAQARFTLGQAYLKKGDAQQAKSTFQTLIAEHPTSTYAKEAEGNLLETELLNLGQPAPQFTFRSINGELISPANFKGKAVLLVFWASWCGGCVEEMPLLKELYAKHKEQGLAVIGISLDDDAKAHQEMVASKGLAWPQIRAGKEGELVKLFNVKGTPTHYLLDRDGKIAAKGVPAAKLNETIISLLKK